VPGRYFSISAMSALLRSTQLSSRWPFDDRTSTIGQTVAHYNGVELILALFGNQHENVSSRFSSFHRSCRRLVNAPTVASARR
jgi:hypothetical protein